MATRKKKAPEKQQPNGNAHRARPLLTVVRPPGTSALQEENRELRAELAKFKKIVQLLLDWRL